MASIRQLTTKNPGARDEVCPPPDAGHSDGSHAGRCRLRQGRGGASRPRSDSCFTGTGTGSHRPSDTRTGTGTGSVRPSDTGPSTGSDRASSDTCAAADSSTGTCGDHRRGAVGVAIAVVNLRVEPAGRRCAGSFRTFGPVRAERPGARR